MRSKEKEKHAGKGRREGPPAPNKACGVLRAGGGGCVSAAAARRCAAAPKRARSPLYFGFYRLCIVARASGSGVLIDAAFHSTSHLRKARGGRTSRSSVPRSTIDRRHVGPRPTTSPSSPPRHSRPRRPPRRRRPRPRLLRAPAADFAGRPRPSSEPPETKRRINNRNGVRTRPPCSRGPGGTRIVAPARRAARP